MKEVIVAAGQTLIDIAVQELGDATRIFEVAELNGRGITDIITAGEVLKVPVYAVDKKRIVNVFSDPANKPASDKNQGFVVDEDSGLEGIEIWAIEDDFIVQ